MLIYAIGAGAVPDEAFQSLDSSYLIREFFLIILSSSLLHGLTNVSPICSLAASL